MEMEKTDSFFFSIVIPVYNVEKYIKDAVQSVLNQKYYDYEMILIDDGSTDASGMICDKYAEIHAMIRVVHQENMGLSKARNAGMELACGKYILFLDGDDMLAEESLQNLENAILEQGAPECILNRRQAFIDGSDIIKDCSYYFDRQKLSGLKGMSLYQELSRLREFWFGAWIFCLSKEAIESNTLYFHEGLFHEDDEWSVRVLSSCKSFGFNNSILYINRLSRKGSIVLEHNIQKAFDLLRIADIIYSTYQISNQKKDAQVLELIASVEVIRSIIESWQYRSCEKYQILVDQIRQRLYMLNVQEKKAFLIVLFFCKVMGIRITSFLLHYSIRIKRVCFRIANS